VPLVGTTEKFSSTAARYFVQLGDLDGAEAVLGHRFSVSGDVVHGDARGGRMLGFPTANLSLPSGVVHPGVGIYAGAARCSSGEWYPAAISVGRRPQFYVDGELLVEAHLVGFTGDLYGTSLDLVFIQWLRGEEIFSSVDELISQMGRDVAQSVAIYQNFADDPDSLLGFSLGQRR
jgi:riboflavin kinase/FMN adenylyltransferase